MLYKAFFSLTAASALAVVPQCRPGAGQTPTSKPGPKEDRPNILFVISDDQSFPHASAYGNTMVSTPHFDRIAAAGALFMNHYVCSPGSSPSRASILTGRYPWQLEEAGTHASSFPMDYKCFTEILQAEGYHVGYTGKGWGPGNWEISGRKTNPAGPVYNDLSLTPPYSGISKIDYTANFKQFLHKRKEGQPFCFWIGTNEPHRAYQADAWEQEALSLHRADVPCYLPQSDMVRADLLNYAIEIEWFDCHLGACIDELIRIGEFDNTLIIVSSDNGMPFPRAKANCYEQGIHVPLAICWGAHIQPKQVVETLTSGVDFFPTLMEAAHVHSSYQVSGQSLLGLVMDKSTRYTSQTVFSGRERHSSARYENQGYPMRSVRWDNYLLIWNIHPLRWPAGDPHELLPDGKLGKGFFDIDESPTKAYVIDNKGEYAEMATAKRPEFELYDLQNDPNCLHNMAATAKDLLDKMKKMLMDRLTETGDSRMGDCPEIWESYPRLSGTIRDFPADL